MTQQNMLNGNDIYLVLADLMFDIQEIFNISEKSNRTKTDIVALHGL